MRHIRTLVACQEADVESHLNKGDAVGVKQGFAGS
jgi:hypothetical protein